MSTGPAKCEQAVTWLRDLHGQASAWARRQPAFRARGAAAGTIPRTGAYVDLMFAFGLAQVGDRDSCEHLLAATRATLAPLGESHELLFRGYEYRVRQALAGKPHRGRLPDEWHVDLETIDRLERMIIDRLRKHSIILEPDERINPYRHWGARVSGFERELAELTDIRDREQFRTRFRALLDHPESGQTGEERRIRVVEFGLNRAGFAGEELVKECVQLALEIISRFHSTDERQVVAGQANFLVSALEATTLHSCQEHFTQLLSYCESWLGGHLTDEEDDPRVSVSFQAKVLEKCIAELFRLNLCDEADQFFHRTSEKLLAGRRMPEWLDSITPAALFSFRAMLQLATGWYAFGWDALADPVINRAVQLLFAGQMKERRLVSLAVECIQAVRLTSRHVAESHLNVVLSGLNGVYDTYTTSSHYSVAQLEVVEAVVLTAVEVCRRG